MLSIVVIFFTFVCVSYCGYPECVYQMKAIDGCCLSFGVLICAEATAPNPANQQKEKSPFPVLGSYSVVRHNTNDQKSSTAALSSTSSNLSPLTSSTAASKTFSYPLPNTNFSINFQLLSEDVISGLRDQVIPVLAGNFTMPDKVTFSYYFPDINSVALVNGPFTVEINGKLHNDVSFTTFRHAVTTTGDNDHWPRKTGLMSVVNLIMTDSKGFMPFTGIVATTGNAHFPDNTCITLPKPFTKCGYSFFC